MLSGASIAAAVRGSPPSGGAAEDRTAWYRAAKFGMFIHWGPYSLASVEASWPIMEPQAGTISEAEYVALSKRFNPTQFDPSEWVRLARAAGQRYMVFTTKHHDGFCMFDSVIHGLQDHADAIREGHRKTAGGNLPPRGDADWVLLLPARHAPPRIPRYFEGCVAELEWRAIARRVAALSRLHGTATDGTVDPVRRGRSHLV